MIFLFFISLVIICFVGIAICIILNNIHDRIAELNEIIEKLRIKL